MYVVELLVIVTTFACVYVCDLEILRYQDEYFGGCCRVRGPGPCPSVGLARVGSSRLGPMDLSSVLSLPQPFVCSVTSFVCDQRERDSENYSTFIALLSEKTIALPTGPYWIQCLTLSLSPWPVPAVQWTFLFKPTSRYTPR